MTQVIRNIQIWPDSEIGMMHQTQAEGRERQVNTLQSLLEYRGSAEPCVQQTRGQALSQGVTLGRGLVYSSSK